MDQIDAELAIQKWQQELANETTKRILAELKFDNALKRIGELEYQLARPTAVANKEEETE